VDILLRLDPAKAGLVLGAGHKAHGDQI